jgi:hypothetical protein
VFDGVFDTESYQLIVAAMLGVAIVNLIIWKKEDKSGKCKVQVIKFRVYLRKICDWGPALARQRQKMLCTGASSHALACQIRHQIANKSQVECKWTQAFKAYIVLPKEHTKTYVEISNIFLPLLAAKGLESTFCPSTHLDLIQNRS